MMTKEALALADRMLDILKDATDVVQRQQAVEILMAGHALRIVGPREPIIVIDGMAKHAKQLVGLLRP
jgi:hypothetical protein